ncbi:peroxiredoxin-like family protein [Terriglobus saanensis]|uniref:thioredoxin-dependent peroxiredoxin n=1 Tax=Terriglobus saanensis (strain ATCC BAA-1853 / DSM 23119 / SP1PR4) TaxID=401053 RepID=E8V0I5_TERSS|nr:peroxiredoxin-like family protein [Terriglobus saanensis]ADV84468.1 alkyl hydroperoxide reductase/ Thiol specific antioxidant/ Mal allergen [Terriglobus saanensis SP1PR4]
MSLAQTLVELRDKFAKILPESATAIMEGHIESLRKSGAVDQIIKPGAKAPTFTLINQHGEDISSVDLIKRGPLVVSFTRGSWCPFCSAEVRALNEAYDQLRQAGVELVVLSPQSLDRTRKQATAGKLKFSLLADTNNEIAKAFGLVYTFPDDLKKIYSSVLNLDIQAINEASSWQLPIPARFFIDGNGVIRDVKADPDYRFRPEPSEVFDIAREVMEHTKTPA